jgi:tRNA G18 (ribose-2'-O)-methylase SpoU
MDAHAPTRGIRCPVCLGETRVTLRVSRKPVAELAHDLPGSSHREETGLAPKAESEKNLAVLLDNVRSAWNVGSILRSAEGFGFAHVYLCGITSTPDNEAVQKTSLGAEDTLTWSYHRDAVQLVKGLKKEGWTIFALEDDLRAVPLESDGVPSKLRAQVSPQRHDEAPALQILIVGNEVTGVDPELLDMCETIFYIPMHGEKKSFNVAIAFGIAAYALK